LPKDVESIPNRNDPDGEEYDFGAKLLYGH